MWQMLSLDSQYLIILCRINVIIFAGLLNSQASGIVLWICGHFGEKFNTRKHDPRKILINIYKLN